MDVYIFYFFISFDTVLLCGYSICCEVSKLALLLRTAMLAVAELRQSEASALASQAVVPLAVAIASFFCWFKIRNKFSLIADASHQRQKGLNFRFHLRQKNDFCLSKQTRKCCGCQSKPCSLLCHDYLLWLSWPLFEVGTKKCNANKCVACPCKNILC